MASELRPPLVVQRFVEHGGVLFKVYVMGDQTAVMRRPSLGGPQLDTAAGVQKLPRVSCASALAHHTAARAAAASSGGGAAAAEADAAAEAAEPPEWVIRATAAALRARLGVMLFNFDMLCPSCPAADSGSSGPPAPQLYYVVDINYFPGIDKLPGFERRLVAFLRSACEGEASWCDEAAAAATGGKQGRGAGGEPSAAAAAAVHGLRMSEGRPSNGAEPGSAGGGPPQEEQRQRERVLASSGYK